MIPQTDQDIWKQIKENKRLHDAVEVNLSNRCAENLVILKIYYLE